MERVNNEGADPLACWAGAWQGLTPQTIPALLDLCADDIRFVDPFNDLRGTTRLGHLLERMFSALDTPCFHVHDRAMGSHGGYLLWTFSALWRGRAISIEGMSEVVFDATGKVSLHRDHWDAGAQVYGKIPVLGAAVRWAQRKFGEG